MALLPAPDEIDGFGERPAVIAECKHVFDDWDGPRAGVARVDTHPGYPVGHKTDHGSKVGYPGSTTRDRSDEHSMSKHLAKVAADESW